MSMVSPVSLLQTMVSSTRLEPFKNSAAAMGSLMSGLLYPEPNGLIERKVQTVKDLLQKCKESGQDPHLAMLCLRSTPLSHDLPSSLPL